MSSLFIPGTMESWRLRRSKYCRGLLGTLDYRCHAGPSGEVNPSCIVAVPDDFKKSSANDIQAEFGLAELDFAESLKQRATDLLNVGFLRRCNGQTSLKRIPCSQKLRTTINRLWEKLGRDPSEFR